MEVFKKLNAVNVSGKVEKKNGLSYLSWAWAWGEVKKEYPKANYKVYENKDGLNYHHDNHTAWVKVGMEIEGIEHIEYLPVMDFRNQSIPVEKLTSFDVNKTIQRALTKAIARHGLGLYIYAGEDMPEDSAVTKIPTQTIDPAFVAKREAEKAKMKADMDTLAGALKEANKAPSRAVDESLGEEWASLPPGPAPLPVGQKEYTGVIKAYYPAEGKKPHKILVDRDYFTSYNKGIAELMSSLTNKQVVITYHSDPWEYNGKSGVNHIVDKIEAK